MVAHLSRPQRETGVARRAPAAGAAHVLGSGLTHHLAGAAVPDLAIRAATTLGGVQLKPEQVLFVQQMSPSPPPATQLPP